MKIIRHFMLAAALLATVPSLAQYSSGGFDLDRSNVYFGVRIGMTASYLSGDYETKTTGSHTGKTFNSDIGMAMGVAFAGIIGIRVSNETPVFLESGLYYAERGAKGDGLTVNYNNLEVPLLIKYGFKVADEIAVLPFVGPYFAYAVSGKTRQPEYIWNNRFMEYELTGDKEKVSSFDEERALTGGLNRFNMGFKFGCGVEYNRIYLEMGFQLGVTNIANDTNVDFSTHSNGLFANFGVNF